MIDNLIFIIKCIDFACLQDYSMFVKLHLKSLDAYLISFCCLLTLSFFNTSH